MSFTFTLGLLAACKVDGASSSNISSILFINLPFLLQSVLASMPTGYKLVNKMVTIQEEILRKLESSPDPLHLFRELT